MERGWTKRWRKRWDRGYHKNFLLWVLMDYFIDFAAYGPKDIYLKGHGMVHLERGEWAFTQRELAGFFNVGRQQIRDQLDFLRKHEFLTQDTTQSRTQHITKVKIINYDTYQDDSLNHNPTKNPKRNQASTQLQPNPPSPTIYTKNKRIKEVVTYSPQFEAFWSEYPKKHKKRDAYDEWLRIDTSNGTFEKIMGGLSKWKASENWHERNGKFIPDPERFIKKRRWEDEVEVHLPGNKGTSRKAGVQRTMEIFAEREHERQRQEAASGRGADADGKLLPGGTL